MYKNVKKYEVYFYFCDRYNTLYNINFQRLIRELFEVKFNSSQQVPYELQSF